MRKLKRIFTGRTWLSVIAIVLLCVVCTGVVARMTDNFTEFDAKEVFARERNEANLLPAEYTGTMGNIGIGVEVTAKDDGTIVLDGKATSSTTITLATLKLPAGTYTLSGVKKASPNGCCLKASVTNWVGDYDNGTDSPTHTFTTETTVTISLYIGAGQEFDNVVIRPMLNEGTTALDFYA